MYCMYGASFFHNGFLYLGKQDVFHGWHDKRMGNSFLRSDSNFESLKFDNNFFTKLHDEQITGHLFLKLTEWEFKEYGMTLRQALELEDYIKDLCE